MKYLTDGDEGFSAEEQTRETSEQLFFSQLVANFAKATGFECWTLRRMPWIYLRIRTPETYITDRSYITIPSMRVYTAKLVITVISDFYINQPDV